MWLCDDAVTFVVASALRMNVVRAHPGLCRLSFGILTNNK